MIKKYKWFFYSEKDDISSPIDSANTSYSKFLWLHIGDPAKKKKGKELSSEKHDVYSLKVLNQPQKVNTITNKLG